MLMVIWSSNLLHMKIMVRKISLVPPLLASPTLVLPAAPWVQWETKGNLPIQIVTLVNKCGSVGQPNEMKIPCYLLNIKIYLQLSWFNFVFMLEILQWRIE